LEQWNLLSWASPKLEQWNLLSWASPKLGQWNLLSWAIFKNIIQKRSPTLLLISDNK
jgi:hypothetical protein